MICKSAAKELVSSMVDETRLILKASISGQQMGFTFSILIFKISLVLIKAFFVLFLNVLLYSSSKSFCKTQINCPQGIN